MCEGVTSNDSLVGLHGHIHEARYESAGVVDLWCVDVCDDAKILVALENHSHFFERGVSGTFSDSVDCDFGLACAVEYALYGIGGSHSEVVMAVSCDCHAINAINVVDKILYLSTKLSREAISGGVGNVDHSGTSLDYRLDYACEIFVFGASRIFGIKLHIFNEALGIGYGSYGTLEDFFAVAIELILDVVVTCANSGMDSSAFCKF